MNNNFRGEFLGFSFRGRHSSEFNITRVTSGDRYTASFFAQITDKTQSVPGKVGEYYFGTQIGNKPLVLNFAFDNVTDWQWAQLHHWLNGEGLGPLIFDEYPYKVYMAKVSANIEPTFLPFDGQHETEIRTIYKGEGNIRFTAYNPNGLSKSIVLGDYTTDDGKVCDLSNVPPWLMSGQILPATSYNRTGALAPAANNQFFVGGWRPAPLDMEIRFNSAARNASNVQNSIASLQSEVGSTNSQITSVTTQRNQVQAQVDNLNQQRNAQVTIVNNSVAQREVNNRGINASMEKALQYLQDIAGYNNKIVALNGEKTQLSNNLVVYNSELLRLNNTLTGLLALVNPAPDKVQQIARTRQDIQTFSNRKQAAESRLSQIEIDLLDTDYYLQNATRDKATEEANIVRLNQNNNQLQTTINQANNTIANLDSQLSGPTQNLYQLNRTITELTGRRDTLNSQINTLSISGLALTGNVVTVTRSAYIGIDGVSYPQQSFTIKIDDILRNKTLRINSVNHNVSYTDAAGIEYEYFDNWAGDFITMPPTGFRLMKTGVFNAGSSLVNTIQMEENLTPEEKAYMLGKNIVFKEDYRNTHQVSQILNIRSNVSTGMDELVLSNGYSLTQGVRNFIVLENFVTVTISDIRFIESINYKFPYVYY